MAKDDKKGVLVIGSGVGGLKAALEVAERGIQVYLVEKGPFFGGEIMQLERQFPTNRCCLCQMLPSTNRIQEGEYCLRRDFYHPLIELIPQAQLVGLSGKEGDFQASIQQQPRGVIEGLCTACRRCIEVCPVQTRDEFNLFNQRKAIYLKGPEPVPPIPAIDWDACTRCGECVNICPTNAIDLKMKGLRRQLSVGSVILAPGFMEFDPAPLTQYGYRRWGNVVTSIEWERILSPIGPFTKLTRPSDGKGVKRVAFILCVGSRERRWDFCSAACCMYSIKEALLAKELVKGIDVSVFYMDLRGFGKGYERYIEQARRKGIRFVRGRTPRVQEDPQTKDLIVSTLNEEGVIKEIFDLVVLAIGQRPPRGSDELARATGVELNEWGFCKTQDPAGVKTTRPGVYVCGSFSEPKDIPDTITQATACALAAAGSPLPGGKKEETGDGVEVSEEPRIGVIICGCKGEVSGHIDVDELKKIIQMRKGVILVRAVELLCVQEKIKDTVAEMRREGVNRLLVAACSPYWFRRRFLDVATGIDPWFVEWVNLREGVINPHAAQDIQQKAQDMILMGLERLRRKEELPVSKGGVKGACLVVGGGLAGLAVGNSLATRGVEVHLVERQGELGGSAKGVAKMEDLLTRYLKGMQGNPLVHIHLQAEVSAVKGQGGDFWATIKGADGEQEVGVGAIVIASGADDYLPKEFLYGKEKRVLTQRELAEGIASGTIQPRDLRSLVMVQCVGARDKAHPWCNRYCCAEALENALLVKEKNPDISVTILFKDMMSYGFRESLYSRARESGVIFIRYADIKEINVKGAERLMVTCAEGEITCDLVVLSTGIIPAKGNKDLAEIFGVQLTEDGFFKEAEPKFRPVDALREGIYICGGAHSPRSWEEIIVQAEAVAQRAMVMLGQGHVATASVVSAVNDRRCSGCALCVNACPYGARIFDDERLVAVVREGICQGCGVCASICPNGAAYLCGFTNGEVMAMIEQVV